MAHIPDSQLHEMILKLPPKERQAMGDIIAGRISKRVRCTACDTVIAEVYNNGNIRAVMREDSSQLLSWRPRLDGNTGFQCTCGNDSRLAEAEKDVAGITNNAIDRSTLEEVYTKLQDKKPSYPVTEKGQEIDGFLIEDIK